jgi:tripartite-type tricarboxylate transporter receptor subunit TctC
VAYLAGSPVVFVVNAESQIKTLQDFLAFARASPEPLTYSSSGIGSYGQLVAETFAQQTGIKVELVPYKGASQGLTDLAGGHIVFAAQTLSSASGLIRGGRLMPLAHTASARVPDYADIPTFAEVGYPDVVGTNWFALAGPAGLPADIVARINQAVVSALSKPEAGERLRDEGLLTQAMTPEAFRAFVETEAARWRPVIKRLGLAQ